MKISLIQQEFKGTKEDTVKKSVELIKKAKGELVILQELHQSEYFCKCENTKYFDYAESFKEDTAFWQKVSREQNIVLVTSLFEKVMDGLYYNTAVIFDKGEIAGKYRKTHIPDDPGFYEKFYFTPGDKIEPIDTSVGRLGVLICWDQWFSEPARIMTLKGAEILIYPTAIGYLMCPKKRVDELCEKENILEEKKKILNAWLNVQRGHAIVNSIYVVGVNRVGKEKDLSKVLEGIEFWGRSFVFGPQGEDIVIADDKERVIDVEIDIDKQKEVRKIWPFFRDRRVDVYECINFRYCKGNK